MTTPARETLAGPLRLVIFGERGSSELEFDPLAGATIGRDETCTVPLESPMVSRRHCFVRVQGSQIVLTDTSANGTIIGDQLVRHATCEVPPGSPVRVGPFLLRFDPPPD